MQNTVYCISHFQQNDLFFDVGGGCEAKVLRNRKEGSGFVTFCSLTKKE